MGYSFELLLMSMAVSIADFLFLLILSTFDDFGRYFGTLKFDFMWVCSRELIVFFL